MTLHRLLVLLLVLPAVASAETGYDAWLRYVPIGEASRTAWTSSVVQGHSPTLEIIAKELDRAGTGMLGAAPRHAEAVEADGAIVVGTPASSAIINALGWTERLTRAGGEGFVIRSAIINKHAAIVIASTSEVGALYGTFHFLRLLQTAQQPLRALAISEHPRLKRRMLDHWDNLDGSIERGYAGRSLWKWDELPGRVDPRVDDYARLNASIGINGSVINSVNANPQSLTHPYIEKAAALANAMRPYGIRVYLSANFAAPKILDNLPTTDPLDPTVARWWKDKAEEIYKLIPDFGGFVVKANSEGQPGPQDYHRTHADGANVLADALAPHGGIVMWRAFVYNPDVDPDRVKRAYKEFVPLDGTFKPNVFAQVKNGPLDFQPREPFHPLFGALPKTPIMTELQITQEYLGQSTHLVYLGTMWQEFFTSDTYAAGPGTTVIKVIEQYRDTGIAGVANTGTDRNWTGHEFGQANWYAFGRLAWNPALTAAGIADEWIRMTWSHDPTVIATIRGIMLDSREAYVNYTMPVGLHHLIGGNHYAPMPENDRAPRPDWTATFFHHAGPDGIGFDRTTRGSDGVSQYRPPLSTRWNSPATTPDTLLLWFHHLPWDYKMKSGRTLWDEIVHHYTMGAEQAHGLETRWRSLDGKVDADRFAAVSAKLHQQVADAEAWRDKCVRYFQQFTSGSSR